MFHHVLDHILNCSKLIFNIFDLIFFLIIFNFLFQFLSNFFFIFFSVFTDFLMSLDFQFNIFILLFNHINFRIEHVNVVIEWVILFFSFNKSCNDFLCGWNSCLLFYLRKSVFNNVNISYVHIHQVLFFFVVVCPFLKSKFQKSNWIREFSSCDCSSIL